jgi:rfaE bifunctional protein kinase chain/domain
MPVRDLLASLNGFKKLSVLVVGDLFLDEYLEGEMFEISKEGPIPVVRLESRTRTPGAAGNLAASLRNLGARVAIAAVVGADARGKELLAALRRKGVDTGPVIVEPGAETFTYSKLRARVENTPSREILRLDVLPRSPLSGRLEKRVILAVRKAARGRHALIVLDQVSHLVSSRLLRELPALARSAGALLHGSSRERIGEFRGFDLVTPNDREAHGAVGGDPGNPRGIDAMGRRLQQVGKHRKLLLTLGARGMALFPSRVRGERLPSLAREVVDVTGAGDAVSSVALLGNVLGWDLRSIAWAASLAAAIAVEHVGTHHVSLEELRDRIRDEGG